VGLQARLNLLRLLRGFRVRDGLLVALRLALDADVDLRERLDVLVRDRGVLARDDGERRCGPQRGGARARLRSSFRPEAHARQSSSGIQMPRSQRSTVEPLRIISPCEKVRPLK